MAKAVYYNSNLDGKTFDVLKSNADGTVDIGTGKIVAVRGATVVKAPQDGCVTLGAEPVEAKPDAGDQNPDGPEKATKE